MTIFQFSYNYASFIPLILPQIQIVMKDIAETKVQKTWREIQT